MVAQDVIIQGINKIRDEMVEACAACENPTSASDAAQSVMNKVIPGGMSCKESAAFHLGFVTGARWLQVLMDKWFNEEINARQPIQNMDGAGQRHLDPVRDMAEPELAGGAGLADSLPTGLPDVVRETVPGKEQA